MGLTHVYLKHLGNCDIFLIFEGLACIRGGRQVLCYCKCTGQRFTVEFTEGQFELYLKENFLTCIHLIEQASCDVMALSIIRNL